MPGVVEGVRPHRAGWGYRGARAGYKAGIAERRIAPAPQRGILYALTEAGRGLQGAVIALALWGNTRLGEQQPSEFVPPSSVVMALRATFNSDAARGLTEYVRAGIRAPGRQ